ncbi:hypothetical protein GCM10009733_007880 [Nonomuraea maheshkhaliensis]|uniref:Uncharacterized protein n=1 Tax=Nonomuraea maheshkhaliensis TaxID=419590 RepID=A0ABP4QR72_9ACTN
MTTYRAGLGCPGGFWSMPVADHVIGALSACAAVPGSCSGDGGASLGGEFCRADHARRAGTFCAAVVNRSIGHESTRSSGGELHLPAGNQPTATPETLRAVKAPSRQPPNPPRREKRRPSPATAVVTAGRAVGRLARQRPLHPVSRRPLKLGCAFTPGPEQ